AVYTGPQIQGVITKGAIAGKHPAQQHIHLVFVALVEPWVRRTALPAHQLRRYAVVFIIALPGIQVPGYFPALRLAHVLVDRGCTAELQSFDPRNGDVDLAVGLEIVTL